MSSILRTGVIEDIALVSAFGIVCGTGGCRGSELRGVQGDHRRVHDHIGADRNTLEILENIGGPDVSVYWIDSRNGSFSLL